MNACAVHAPRPLPWPGFEYVMPPMLEYLESLLTGAGPDLKLRTFQLVGPVIRPDNGRACRHYAPGGANRRASAQPRRRHPPVLLRQRAPHACRPALPQVVSRCKSVAELYGYAGIAADLDIIRLMAGAFDKGQAAAEPG